METLKPPRDRWATRRSIADEETRFTALIRQTQAENVFFFTRCGNVKFGDSCSSPGNSCRKAANHAVARSTKGKEEKKNAKWQRHRACDCDSATEEHGLVLGIGFGWVHCVRYVGFGCGGLLTHVDNLCIGL